MYILQKNVCEFGRGGNQLYYIQLANKLGLFNNNVNIRIFNSMSDSIYLLHNELVIEDGELFKI